MNDLEITTSPVTKKNVPHLLSWIILAILLGVGIVCQQLYLSTQNLHQQLQEANAQIQGLVQHVSAQATQLQGMTNARSTASEHFALLQIADNLRQAHMIMKTYGSPATALFLLQEANQQLGNLREPRFEEIQKKLYSAILSLQVAAKQNTEQTLLQLQSLNGRLQEAPTFVATEHPLTAQLPVNAGDAGASESRAFWHRLWKNLAPVIIVRQHTKTIAALPTPSQEVIYRDNLFLLLQEAQWAVLHHQPKLYQQSLEAADETIEALFARNPALRASAQASIAELQAFNVAPALPDINSVLTVIQTALRTPVSTSAEVAAS